MTSYEDVRQRIERLPVSRQVGSRTVEWMTSAAVIGVARDVDGKVEIFLRGIEVRPLSSSVKEASEYRTVYRDDGSSFEATRLVLPALSHFDQVAAFVCAELLRNGADSDLGRAFTLTEPIIRLAMEKLTLSNEALLGLAGELLFLEVLCRQAADARVLDIITGWHGWRRSARDFVLDDTGIEVKTTTGFTSSHHVEGVHQVEREQGGDEARFFLVSIGLQRAGIDTDNAFTVPSLVERIKTRMASVGVSSLVNDQFIARVAEYGAVSWNGYDHNTQSSEPGYNIPYQTMFFRAYDMDSSDIGVLRSEDIEKHRHVVDGSVRFQVDLSSHGAVSVDNPVEGANQVAHLILNN